MSTTLNYAIRYVADMDQSVAFHQQVLGLVLRFRSPGWSEFETGATTLALHPATPEHAAGTCQLGFGVPDIEAFHAAAAGAGIEFTAPPTVVHGIKVARFLDADGAECSVGGQ